MANWGHLADVMKDQRPRTAQVGSPPSSPPGGGTITFEIGDRVKVSGISRVLGTVRYVGPHKQKKGRTVVGVELDEPKGKNNGTVDGELYFRCSPKHGVIVHPLKITRVRQDFVKEDFNGFDAKDGGDADGENFGFQGYDGMSAVEQLEAKLADVEALVPNAVREIGGEAVKRMFARSNTAVEEAVYAQATSEERERIEITYMVEASKATVGPAKLALNDATKAAADADRTLEAARERSANIATIGRYEHRLKEANERVESAQGHLEESEECYNEVRAILASRISTDVAMFRSRYDAESSRVSTDVTNRIVTACGKIVNHTPLAKGEIVEIAVGTHLVRAKVETVNSGMVRLFAAVEKSINGKPFEAEVFENEQFRPRHEVYAQPPKLLQTIPSHRSTREAQMTWLREQGETALVELRAAVDKLMSKGSSELQSGTKVLSGPLKKSLRSFVKIFEKYKGDPRRLLDMARITVVCKSAELLAELTELWQKNPKILRCHRMKVRLHKCYNVLESGGYRDILANVEVSIGSHTYICEVQLTIKPILDIKNGGAHTTYTLGRMVGAFDPVVNTINGAVDNDDAYNRIRTGLVMNIIVNGSTVDLPRLKPSIESKHCHLVDLTLGGCKGLKGENVNVVLSPKVLDQLAPTVVKINVAATGVVGQIPDGMKKCTKLKVFMFQANEMTGTIPTDLFDKLPDLEELWVDRNKFHGTLPDNLRHCTKLKQLFVNNNQFTGNLPEGMFAGMTLLVKLRFDKNKFTGPIPRDLKYCINLKKLHFNTNQFSGDFPHGVFGCMTQMEDLRMFHNKLTGTMAPDIKYCTKMKYFSPDDPFVADAKKYLLPVVPDCEVL